MLLVVPQPSVGPRGAPRTRDKAASPTRRHTGHCVRGTQTMIPCRDPPNHFFWDRLAPCSSLPSLQDFLRDIKVDQQMTLAQDTSSCLRCCDSSPCTSCAHPCVSKPCESPPCTGAGWRLFPVAASTARSRPQGLAIPEGTTVPPGRGASGCCWLTAGSGSWGSAQLWLQLGKGSCPWLQSLAPFLPCLQAERSGQRSSPDMHPAGPRQEGLRAKSSSPRGEVR